MIIVTGGAGCIGSNLVRGLNRAGVDDILIVDNLDEVDKHRNLDGARFLDFVDKRDFLARLPGFVGQVQAVFHEGACTVTTERDGTYLLRNNYEYSKTLLAWCLDRHVHFLYASSASVYGAGEAGFAEDERCEHPLNGYAFSKLLFDRWVRRLLSGKSQAGLPPVVGLRYFNVYGPNERHKGAMASPVLQFHRQVVKTGALKLFAGSEAFRRDFVFVDDVVSVNLFFLERPDKSGIFNCGTGEAHSFSEVAGLVTAHREGVRIETVPFPEALAGKYQSHTCADLIRLRAEGYASAFTPLEQGVACYTKTLDSADRTAAGKPESKGT